MNRRTKSKRKSERAASPEERDVLKCWDAIAQKFRIEPEPWMFDTFIAWAAMAGDRAKGRPAFLNQYWIRCKSWKQLSEFPRRVENLADDIEAINTEPVWIVGGERYNAPRPRNAFAHREWSRASETDLRKFGQLPMLLRAYAAALKARTEFTAARTPRSGRLQAIDEISETVRKLTGKFRDREVADFLNAVDTLLCKLGIKAPSTRQFDELSIAQSRSRRKT